MTSKIMAAVAIVSIPFLAGCSRGEQESAPTADTNAAAPPAVEAASAVAYASLTGDAAKGEKLFLQCKACHTVEPGQNRVGPSLHNIVGRTAGSVAGYNYSPANKNSGFTWSEEQLYAYLEDPRAFIPGTKMAFAGVKRPQDRADIVAYLKTASN